MPLLCPILDPSALLTLNPCLELHLEHVPRVCLIAHGLLHPLYLVEHMREVLLRVTLHGGLELRVVLPHERLEHVRLHSVLAVLDLVLLFLRLTLVLELLCKLLL